MAGGTKTIFGKGFDLVARTAVTKWGFLVYPLLAIGVIMMLIGGRAWYNERREQNGWPPLKLEPSYLILIGLIIAGVGVSWQLYREFLSPRPAVASSVSPTPGSIPAPAPAPAAAPAKRQLTDYEIRQKLMRLDQGLLILEKELPPALAEMGNLMYNAQTESEGLKGPDGDRFKRSAPFLKRFGDARNALVGVMGKIQAVVDDTPPMADITAILQAPDTQRLIEATGRFEGAYRSGIQLLDRQRGPQTPNDPQVMPAAPMIGNFVQPFTVDWDREVKPLYTWRVQAVEKLLALRREVER
jgi:hypothetical protein